MMSGRLYARPTASEFLEAQTPADPDARFLILYTETDENGAAVQYLEPADLQPKLLQTVAEGREGEGPRVVAGLFQQLRRDQWEYVYRFARSSTASLSSGRSREPGFTWCAFPRRS